MHRQHCTIGAIALLALGLSPTASTAAAQDAPAAKLAARLLDAWVPAYDDADRLAAELMPAATAHATSAVSALLIEAVRRAANDLQAPEKVLAGLSQYLAARPHGLGARAARALQTTLLVNTGRLDRALALRAESDFAAAVLAIGPFGDEGDYHSGVAFPPELRFPDADASLDGRYGPVRARLAEREPLQTTIDLAKPGSGQTGCFYGLHQVDVDADAFGYLEVECRGSFEVFLNGVHVGGLDRHAERVGTTVWLAVLLPKGRNHTLVKTTLNSQSQFSLRYVDAAGVPLKGVVAAADQTRLLPAVAAAAPREAPPFADGLQTLLAAAPGADSASRPTLLLAAALTANREGFLQIALATLDELEPSAPSRGTAGLAMARALLDARMLPTELRQGRARRIIEGLGAEMADHHSYTMLHCGFLQDDDKREEAVRLLQQRAADGKAGAETYARLVGLLQALRFNAEGRRALDAWQKALPQDPRPVLAQAALRGRGGDARGAFDLLRLASGRTAHPSFYGPLLALALDLGEADVALQTVDKIHAHNPQALPALLAQAQALRLLGRTDAAMALYERIATHAAASARQLREAGDELLRAGRAAVARAAYDRSLALDPSQHALRRQLAREDGGDNGDYADFAPFRREIAPLIAAFEPGERELGATSSLILDQMLIEILEDGSMVEETHQLRRINDLQGVEQFQEAQDAARARELLTVRTIAKDGSEYVPHRVAESFSMPRLEPGAFIETRFRNFDPSPAPGPKRATTFFFQGSDEPFLLSEMVVIVPESLRGEFRMRNFDGSQSTKKLSGGRVAHVFTKQDVPRLASEKNPPPREEIMPIVTWGEDGAADAKAREAYARALYTTSSSAPIAARAIELVAGVAGDSARMHAIHRYVHDEIANPQGAPDPTSILLTKMGPRFHLEVALLREAAVPIQHAICARERETMSALAEPFFAGEDNYEVMAVRIEPRDGDPVWLFADEPRHWPLGRIPTMRQGAPALMLGEDGPLLVRLPGGEAGDEGTALQATVTLGADADASLSGTIAVQGWVGFLLADRLRNMKDNVQQLVARQFIGQVLEGWRITELDLAPLRQTGNPLRARGTLTRRGALEKTGEHWLLKLPLSRSELLDQFGDRGNRTLPLRLTSSYADSWDVVVDPGEHYRFLEVPATTRVRQLLLDYQLSFHREGDKLRIRRVARLEPGTIVPSQFDEWLRLLRRLDLAEELQLRVGAR